MLARALLRFALVVIAAGVAACGTAADVGDVDGTGSDGTDALDVDSILAFLNGPSAGVDTLVDDVRIQHRAAWRIVAHVRGADKALGTADDDLLGSIEELDAIRYVGPSTIEAIRAYVRAHAAGSDLTVEGVAMTSEQAAQMVALANSATKDALDGDVGLDSRAAANIVAARPLVDIQALAAVSYVGTNALTRMRDWVVQHPTTTTDPGTLTAQAPIPFVLEWINDYRKSGGHVTRLNLNRDGTYDATIEGRGEHGLFFGPTAPPTENPVHLRLVSDGGAEWSAGLTLWTGQSADTVRDGRGDSLLATLPTDGEDMCDSGGGQYRDDDANADGLYCDCDGTKSWIPSQGGCVN